MSSSDNMDEDTSKQASLELQHVSEHPRVVSEEEGVFEIRDFSAVSSFEKLVHQISMATKRWCLALQEGKNALIEELKLEESEYELLFRYMPFSGHTAQASISQLPPERLGLHTFALQAHEVQSDVSRALPQKLQQWFGVQHFVILSVPDKDYMALNHSRMLLSALVLAVRSQYLSGHPLSCFVPVEGGNQQRFIGEGGQIGWRTVYNADSKATVSKRLEHLEGLLEFFFKKIGADPKAPSQSLSMCARFTYMARSFDPLHPTFKWEMDATSFSLQSRSRTRSRSSIASLGNSPLSVSASGGCGNASPTSPENVETSDINGTKEIAIKESEPAEEIIETLTLYVVWPWFQRGSFVDNEYRSDLDPFRAPHWKLCVMCKDRPNTLNANRLKNLLSFRDDAKKVGFAVNSVRSSNSSEGSLSIGIQNWTESLLLPTQEELDAFRAECLDYPVCVSVDSTSSDFHRQLRGAVRGTRLAILAEIVADLKCFKGALMLWCELLSLMRTQWDQGENFNLEGSAPPSTQREPGSGLRTEYFSNSNCLLQQKFELLQRSFEARFLQYCPSATTHSTRLRAVRTDKALNAPTLVFPALLTHDVQQKILRESITDPMETGGREIRFDIAAFKAANERVDLDDFLAWRSEVEGLDNNMFPREWFQQCWEDVVARPASEQMEALFNPEKEVYAAFDELEHIEGSRLLLQLFRVLLVNTIEDLSDVEFVHASPRLSSLRDKAREAAIKAFGCCVSDIGEEIYFPEETSLEALLEAIQNLEIAISLARSLRHKLRRVAPSLIDELLTSNEVLVTTSDDQKEIMTLLEPARKSPPHCKEFIILRQPHTESCSEDVTGRHMFASCNEHRLYAEIRDRHTRLAIGRTIPLL